MMVRTGVLGAVAQVTSLCFFYYKLEWGFISAPAALAVMFTLRFIIAYRIVHVSGKYPAYEDVRLFSLETVSNTKPMVVLGLKAVCM